jgi:spermidine/putrescine transport system substrate-binding protein
LSARTRVVVLAVLAVLAAACGDESPSGGAGGGDLPFAGQTLTVANWKDYGSDIPWAVKHFEELTGAKVVHQYFNSEEELLNMLRSGGVGNVDVALPNLAYLQPAIDDGLLQPVDSSRLKNFELLAEKLRAQKDLSRDGKLYGVPWMWGSTSLAYNTEAVEGPVDSWSVLWDPGNRGQVGFFDDAPTAIQTAALYLGEDPYDPDLERVRETLLDLKGNVRLFWASADDWTKAFSTGEITMGNLWSGLAGTQIANGDPVAYVVPKEGAVGWLDSWTIVKEAPHPELAYKWIDYMTSVAFQSRWAQDPDRSSPGPANLEALESLPKDVIARIQADPAMLDKLTLQRAVPPQELEEWTKLWQEVKAG